MKKNILIYLLTMLLILGIAPAAAFAGAQPANDDPGYFRAKGNADRSFYSTTPSKKAAMDSIIHDERFRNFTIHKGIDVSKYNGTIDWKKVKASGIDFAFVRVAYRGYGSKGNLAEDPNYDANIKGALNAGVQVGVYIFSQAITVEEAREEANYIMDRIKNYSITLPVVMDFEYTGENGTSGRLYDAHLTKAAATNICLAFADTVKSKVYQPAVYANKSMLTSNLDAKSISSKYDIWLANWGARADYSGDYTFWQYSDSGSVPGISGKVDTNFWYRNPKPSITVTKTSGLKNTAKTKTSLKLSWSRNSSAEGYELYRATSPNGSFSKIKTITSAASTSLTNTGLPAGREYYYKVRGYRTVNGTTYRGAFSPVLKAYTTKPYTRTATTKSSSIIRSGAGTAYTKVVTVPKKKALSVYCDTRDKAGSTWYRVKYSKSGKAYTGYIKGSLVTIKKTGTVSAGSLAVRKNAGTQYGKKASLNRGKEVVIKASKKDRKGNLWYRVAYTKGRKTITGYVLSNYIK